MLPIGIVMAEAKEGHSIEEEAVLKLEAVRPFLCISSLGLRAVFNMNIWHGVKIT